MGGNLFLALFLALFLGRIVIVEFCVLPTYLPMHMSKRYVIEVLSK